MKITLKLINQKDGTKFICFHSFWMEWIIIAKLLIGTHIDLLLKWKMLLRNFLIYNVYPTFLTLSNLRIASFVDTISLLRETIGKEELNFSQYLFGELNIFFSNLMILEKSRIDYARILLSMFTGKLAKFSCPLTHANVVAKCGERKQFLRYYFNKKYFLSVFRLENNSNYFRCFYKLLLKYYYSIKLTENFYSL